METKTKDIILFTAHKSNLTWQDNYLNHDFCDSELHAKGIEHYVTTEYQRDKSEVLCFVCLPDSDRQMEVITKLTLECGQNAMYCRINGKMFIQHLGPDKIGEEETTKFPEAYFKININKGVIA